MKATWFVCIINGTTLKQGATVLDTIAGHSACLLEINWRLYVFDNLFLSGSRFYNIE